MPTPGIADDKTTTDGPQTVFDSTSNPGTKKDGNKFKHSCPYESCPRIFTCPHNVHQHIREKHTDERPYTCPWCSAAFTRGFSLYRHADNVHGRDIRPLKKKRKRELTKNATRSLGDVAIAADGTANRSRVPQHPSEEWKVDSENLTGSSNGSTPSAQPLRSTPLMTDATFCQICFAPFDDPDSVLVHLHVLHQQPYSYQCPCSSCKILRESQNLTAGCSKILDTSDLDMPRSLVAVPQAMKYLSLQHSQSTTQKETKFYYQQPEEAQVASSGNAELDSILPTTSSTTYQSQSTLDPDVHHNANVVTSFQTRRSSLPDLCVSAAVDGMQDFMPDVTLDELFNGFPDNSSSQSSVAQSTSQERLVSKSIPTSKRRRRDTDFSQWFDFDSNAIYSNGSP